MVQALLMFKPTFERFFSASISEIQAPFIFHECAGMATAPRFSQPLMFMMPPKSSALHWYSLALMSEVEIQLVQTLAVGERHVPQTPDWRSDDSCSRTQCFADRGLSPQDRMQHIRYI